MVLVAVAGRCSALNFRQPWCHWIDVALVEEERDGHGAARSRMGQLVRWKTSGRANKDPVVLARAMEDLAAELAPPRQ